MKSFFYNNDKTQFLVPFKIQTQTENFFDWEINFLKTVIANSPASKKEVTSLLLALKDFATSCTGFKDVKSYDTNGLLAEVMTKYYKENKLSELGSLIKGHNLYVENYSMQNHYSYNQSNYSREKSSMYGSHRVSYYPTSIISVKVQSSKTIGDTTPNSRLDLGRLKKQQNFSVCAKALQDLLNPFLQSYSLLNTNLPFTGTLESGDYYSGSKSGSSKINFQIEVSQVVKRLDAFIESIDKLLSHELKDCMAINIDDYKEMEWKGSLGDINNFSLSQAFYLIGNTKKGENGFIGLMPTQHSYSTFFRFGIVKDIANAHLFHKLPPKDLTREFEPLSQVNVDIDFKSVENADKNSAATLIDSFIIKAKLENSIASLTTRESSGEGLSAPIKKNKI